MYWAASDVGWVVGHSYIVYAPLLHGCTTVLYEGKPVGTPDAGAFWRVDRRARCVDALHRPHGVPGDQAAGPGRRTTSAATTSRGFRALFLAGERCDPETLRWAEEKLGVPVIDHWWQTETGWAIAANCLGIERLPVKPGLADQARPGWDVAVFDAAGEELPSGEIGALVIKLPMPPGTSPTLWNADDRFREATSPPSPATTRQPTPATSTRTATSSSWRGPTTSSTSPAIGSPPARSRRSWPPTRPSPKCAVIGVADELKGQLPVGFLVLKAGVERGHDEIVGEVVQLVRERIGPVASFKTAVVVDRLPKTRSGKILRGTMRRIADGVDYTIRRRSTTRRLSTRSARRCAASGTRDRRRLLRPAEALPS